MRRENLRTPCYVIREAALRENGRILRGVAQRTGCKILLAQKCFSAYGCYPVLAEYLDGTEASGLYEARLGAEEMPERECHVFSAAFRPDEFPEILRYADHVVFNSLEQVRRFAPAAQAAGVSVGLRVNPECSTQSAAHALYDPCAPGSRLGVTRDVWERDGGEALRPLLDGLHFHTLCEQDSDALETTLEAFLQRFSDLLPSLKWVNLGGGHHITRPDYDRPRLERCIRRLTGRGLTVYLEPGEAVVWNAGELLTTVLEVQPLSDAARAEGLAPCAILDTSAACHMPDVLEVPYCPPLVGAGAPGEKAFSYRLGSQTCLAGDTIGDYSFDQPLKCGDRLTFGDMALYTMVKTNTFNGMPLPDIVLEHADGSCTMWRRFGYETFKARL